MNTPANRKVAFSGHFEEAVAKRTRGSDDVGASAGGCGNLAATFADWGKPSEAEAVYLELIARARQEYALPAQGLKSVSPLTR